MQTHDTPEKSYDLERLIFFSDGVFAIAITLLVIELRPPQRWDRTLAGLWGAEWRSLLAYAVSFLAVGAYWNAHRRLFARVVRFHPGLIFLNLVLLSLVVLMPFAAELIFDSGPRGEPFAAYLGLIAAIGAAQALLWTFAAFVFKVTDPAMASRERLFMTLTLALVPMALGAASVAAWYGADSSVWIWSLPFIVLANLGRRRMLAARR
ncbi:TMEM175 family protein [Phenylobacterium sp.]|uniref:TMEM175 family protein n=1 Tax=Phenylobacterium sp. TaxID=1871053 RepID=UPI002DEDC9EA|nr:TMEM175 family protein [Phenylobacterium sp.]